jgi:predicted MFS family arabinose efflux permease
MAITLTPAAVSLLLAAHPLTTGFLLSGGLALAAAGLAWQLPARRAGGPRGAGLRLVFPRRLWPSMVAAGLLGVGFTAFFQFAPLLAARRGTLDVGWLYTSYGLGLILVRLGVGGLVDRWGTPRMLVLTVLLMAAGLDLFAVAATPSALLVASLLVAVAGLFHPTLLAHHAALLPAAPGQASAAFYLGFDLGIGLGSGLLGWTLAAVGVVGLYAAACVVVLGVLPLVPVIARQTPAPMPAAADGD